MGKKTVYRSHNKSKKQVLLELRKALIGVTRYEGFYTICSFLHDLMLSYTIYHFVYTIWV